MKSRYFTISEYPQGTPPRDTFVLRDTELPELAEGEVRIRNTWLSVDPYMRGRMSGVKTYVDPFQLDEPLEGAAVGEVIESREQRVPAGTKVTHMGGWRDVAQMAGDTVQPLPDLGVSDEAFLGVLGMPGMTAWTGLNTIAEIKSGDNVLVSAAGGAVGSLAVQLARAKGGTVVGIAGTAAKRQWLDAHGVVPVDYHNKDASQLTTDLQQACPEGFDVYYENVGGTCLEAALNMLRAGARIAICGMIARYNDERPAPGPANLSMILIRRARMQGFIVFDHWGDYPRFLESVGPLVARGEVDHQTTVEEGLERAPDAFLALFAGANQGKMLVKL